MERAELTAAIKDAARRVGFDAVGVARAGDADPEGRLRAWLARGDHAGLAYMEHAPEIRADPTRYMPGARSVIALAHSYHHPAAEAARAGAGAKVARYALGDDYHRVVRRKLRKLRNAILALAPGHQVGPVLDTSPVLERAWAERAGIAWIGKSSMAISEHLGTYTFLAGMITTLELDYDTPHTDRCGTCTACLDACPTGAFRGPYQLDARRCITFWTIEHRGEIPPEAPPPHGWLAGCDVCQEVCPWNKFERPSGDRHFSPRPALAAPDLAAFAEDGAPRAIAGTALQRTGAESMRRNALRVIEERTGLCYKPAR